MTWKILTATARSSRRSLPRYPSAEPPQPMSSSSRYLSSSTDPSEASRPRAPGHDHGREETFSDTVRGYGDRRYHCPSAFAADSSSAVLFVLVTLRSSEFEIRFEEHRPPGGRDATSIR